MPNPEGRPRKFKTPEDMQAAVDAYFEDREKNNKPPTITGLALWLGFVCINSLKSYEGYGEEFFRVIKTARTRMISYHEEKLFNPDNNAACKIFWMKVQGFKEDDVKEAESSTADALNNIADKLPV